MNSKELLQLIKGKDKESLTLELKTRNTLRNKQEDIAATLVSLANRYGGQLLIGVKDSGELDGKYNSPKEVDDDKGIIDNICTQKCSPPIEYTAELLESSEGDVLVVNIGGIQDIPHAVIKKKGGEIKERTYYTRTSHGKRLVTDSQVKWIFNNPSEYLESKRFLIKIVYNRKNYQMKWFTGIKNQNIVSDLFMSYFLQDNTDNLKSTITSSEASIYKIFLNLLPYSTLNLLGNYYPRHWNKNIKNPDPKTKQYVELSDVTNAVDVHPDYITQYVTKDNLPRPIGFSAPIDLKITMDGDSKRYSEVTLDVKDLLQVKIAFKGGGWSIGLPHDHPLSAMLNNIKITKKSSSKYAHCVFVCETDAWLNVFNIAYANYEDYQTCISSIVTALEAHYSWDKYKEESPDSVLYRIDWNLRNLIKKMYPKTDV